MRKTRQQKTFVIISSFSDKSSHGCDLKGKCQRKTRKIDERTTIRDVCASNNETKSLHSTRESAVKILVWDSLKLLFLMSLLDKINFPCRFSEEYSCSSENKTRHEISC
jgi:hypothetical protein